MRSEGTGERLSSTFHVIFTNPKDFANDKSPDRRHGKRLASLLACCSCLALLLLAAACKQPTPADTRAADENTIRDLDAQWSKTAEANDLEEFIASWITANSGLAHKREGHEFHSCPECYGTNKPSGAEDLRLRSLIRL